MSVHGEGTRAELPTLEYANESPAAIVLAEQDGWFKIRLSGGAGWLRASPRDQFMPLADLFSVYPTLTTLTEAFSGPLLDAPGGTAASVERRPRDRDCPFECWRFAPSATGSGCRWP